MSIMWDNGPMFITRGTGTRENLWIVMDLNELHCLDLHCILNE